jgi:Protein of unknown function (DUF3105)
MPLRLPRLSFAPPTRRYWLAAAALSAGALWSANVWLEGKAVAAAAAKLEASRGTVTFSHTQFQGTDAVSFGVEKSYHVLDRGHSLGRVRYDVIPPVGGTHDPIWLNCGVYTAPVRNENAVHSLEHGAVWITYRPADVNTAQLQQLLKRFGVDGRVLISPYPTQPAPVIVTAWGVQLRLEKTDSVRLRAFVIAHRDRAASPEPNGPCRAGTGFPVALKRVALKKVALKQKGNP